MARKRYISTKISTDKVVNQLAMEYGDFAALLYTWLIPHAEDNATVTGDPEELLMTVCPGRRDKTRDDIINALEGMAKLELIYWDHQAMLIYFPISTFYKYQSYIKPLNRRVQDPVNTETQAAPENAGEQRKAAEDVGEHKKTAEFAEGLRPTPENAASPSLPDPDPDPDLGKYIKIRNPDPDPDPDPDREREKNNANNNDPDRVREAPKEPRELDPGALAWRSWYERATAGAWPSAKWADHLDELVAQGMDHALIISVLEAKRCTTSHFLSAASSELGSLFAAGVSTLEQAATHRQQLEASHAHSVKKRHPDPPLSGVAPPKPRDSPPKKFYYLSELVEREDEIFAASRAERAERLARGPAP